MNQTIAVTGFRVLEKRTAEESFAVGMECHVHWIVHATGEDNLHFRTIRSRTKNMRRMRHKLRFIGEGMLLLRKRTFAPIDATVAAKIRAM